MPQTVTITSDAYSFDELDERAKERARDWYRECIDEDDFSCEIDEFASICDILGIDLKTHEVALMSGKTRSDPNIWYSIGGCQGDGACFEGTYSHNGDSCAKIREIFGEDSTAEPVRIADELNALQVARIIKASRPDCTARQSEKPTITTVTSARSTLRSTGMMAATIRSIRSSRTATTID
jgi:hypothetical protein